MNGVVEVCVSDSGRGVDPEIEPYLFEAFHSTKPDGVGIGLSICRTIIEAHDGKIWAENAAEGGARFCFSLPSAA
jgi:two-component system sensor kinase FixL